MKIKVTLDEAKKAVLDLMVKSPDVYTSDIEIEGIYQNVSKPNCSLVEFFNLAKAARMANKIAVIKEIRSLASDKGLDVGLCDAKTFVEAVMTRNY